MQAPDWAVVARIREEGVPRLLVDRLGNSGSFAVLMASAIGSAENLP
jgi:hypothetical protein